MLLSKNTLFVVIILLIASTLQLETFQVPNCQKSLTNIFSQTRFNINNGQISSIPTQNQTEIGQINYFVHDQNGSAVNTSQSKLQACHDQNFLYLNYTLKDSDIIANLKGCNSALYTQDAVQFFISSNNSYPNDYFEFQISPRGELFFADINNPFLDCTKLNTNYQSCTSVKYGATITADGWTAWLIVDLSILSRGSSRNRFYGNFYRIDKNAGKTTQYLCWQSTMANPPCFHKPGFFGEIVLI